MGRLRSTHLRFELLREGLFTEGMLGFVKALPRKYIKKIVKLNYAVHYKHASRWQRVLHKHLPQDVFDAALWVEGARYQPYWGASSAYPTRTRAESSAFGYRGNDPQGGTDGLQRIELTPMKQEIPLGRMVRTAAGNERLLVDILRDRKLAAEGKLDLEDPIDCVAGGD